METKNTKYVQANKKTTFPIVPAIKFDVHIMQRVTDKKSSIRESACRTK